MNQELVISYYVVAIIVIAFVAYKLLKREDVSGTSDYEPVVIKFDKGPLFLWYEKSISPACVEILRRNFNDCGNDVRIFLEMPFPDQFTQLPDGIPSIKRGSTVDLVKEALAGRSLAQWEADKILVAVNAAKIPFKAPETLDEIDRNSEGGRA